MYIYIFIRAGHKTQMLLNKIPLLILFNEYHVYIL